VDIHDTRPTVTRFDSDGNPVENVAIDDSSETYDHISVHGAGGSPNPGPLASLYASVSATTGAASSGYMEGETASVTGDLTDELRLVYNVYSSAEAAANNVSVTSWDVYVVSTLISEAK